MGIAEELKKEELEAARRNNGTIMRAIFISFKRGWFSITELTRTLEAYAITKEIVMDAIDYFQDCGYIKTRDSITKTEAAPAEIAFLNIEFSLCAKKGYRLGKGAESDSLIEL